MGGCASRPKDFDINEPAPVQAPAVDKSETEPIAQENNRGDESKTKEALVDQLEAAGETTKSPESKPTEETAMTEEKVEAQAKAEAEAKPEVASAEAVVAAEPTEVEVKLVEAQNSEDKTDAPLVTM